VLKDDVIPLEAGEALVNQIPNPALLNKSSADPTDYNKRPMLTLVGFENESQQMKAKTKTPAATKV